MIPIIGDSGFGTSIIACLTGMIREPNDWILSSLFAFLCGTSGIHLPVLSLDAGNPIFDSLTLGDSITDRSIAIPSAQEIRRLLSLQDYNTRIVLLGATLLGIAAGTIGSFTLLRRRALMGDALSHATLPGIGIAFLVTLAVGSTEKSLPWLLCGAALSGIVGMLGILFIRSATRLKEDAALGIVLSVFFGGGIAILGIIQQLPEGHAAGLESFIYGKTASMVATDAWLIGVAGLAATLVAILFFKELKLLCFDEKYAASCGFPILTLDLMLMALVTIVTIIGLQAVGLILMIALMVIPASAARFWTEKMTTMTWLSGLLGGMSCLVGAALSAVVSRLPSGAVIVLVATVFFLISMFVGSERGLLIRRYRRLQMNWKVDYQHLLRALYECLENQGLMTGTEEKSKSTTITREQLLSMRSWSPSRLGACLSNARKKEMITIRPDGSVRLTSKGFQEAERLVHEHRLWELYLITHADTAPSRVDRDADTIEHVLDSEMIAKLESLLQSHRVSGNLTPSPHSMLDSPDTPETPVLNSSSLNAGHAGMNHRGTEQ